MTRFPDDTGRADLDTCAQCGRPFASGQVWVVGVRDDENKRRVIHGGCQEAWNRRPRGLTEKRPRLRPRKPEAYT